MKFFLLSFFLFFIQVIGYTQTIKIGVLRDVAVKKVSLSYLDGSYSIFADSIDFGAILQNEFVQVSFAPNRKVKLLIGVIDKGMFSSVSLIETKNNSAISLSASDPIVKEHRYMNDFNITSNDKCLTLVNSVSMNNYLCGVLESEGGLGKELDYYKVQALMSRTYALKYKRKHIKDGFDLCDGVHCQAYHSMLRYTSTIKDAVKATEDNVIKDIQGNLVDSYFHANCGGQTSEADYIWNSSIPYLNSFMDTFCIYTKQATWEKKIPKTKWMDFMVKKYDFPIYDSIYAPLLFSFNQSERLAFYHSPILGIPLRDIRLEFKLKSTFFNVYLENNEVVLRGRGYGHGVGLCQEGAMRMARYGYNFKQIANYYFPSVIIHNLKEDLFFGQKENLVY